MCFGLRVNDSGFFYDNWIILSVLLVIFKCLFIFFVEKVIDISNIRGVWFVGFVYLFCVLYLLDMLKWFLVFGVLVVIGY